MNECILDSSALLAFLAAEEGAEFVLERLRNGVCMSAVNWAEVVSKFSDLGQEIDRLDILVKGNGQASGTITIVPLLLEDAKTIGQLRGITRKLGLSLGDRACLALGLRSGLPIFTADRSWLKLGLSLKIDLVR